MVGRISRPRILLRVSAQDRGEDTEDTWPYLHCAIAKRHQLNSPSHLRLCCFVDSALCLHCCVLDGCSDVREP
jgi:hypothetical protein